MAVFPLQYLTTTDTPVAYNARYKTQPLGKKFAGQPKGVYVGFIPSTLGSVLSLSPDPIHGYSLIKVPSREDPAGMDIIVTDAVDLDFAAQPDVDFPLLVIARSRHYDDPDRPTTASLVTRSGTVTSVADNEVLICIVNGPAASISVVNDPTMGEQDSPLALTGVNFGFMPGGSVEDLQAAADIVNEVVAARVGLDSTIYPSLSDRLSADYSAESIAGRLGLVFRALRSNDYAVVAGVGSVNISGSFSEIDRDYLPAVTLDGRGSETTEGAISDPVDDVRNVALVVDATTGYRLIDNDTDRRIVFGRISGPTTIEIGGEWRFLNASRTVTAIDNAGQATVELMVGDTILGADGKYYEIETILNDNNVELKTAYQSPTSVTTTSIRRWTLEPKRIVSGVEEDTTFFEDTTIRFFFPAFVSRGKSTADWMSPLYTSAERPPLAPATTVIPGLLRLATSGAQLGEIRIQNAGAPLGGGPYHSINFSAAEASVSSSPTAGEVVVNEIGPSGAPGLAGASGGPGPVGATGPGFSQLNPFEDSQIFSNPLASLNPYSFTMNMGHNIRYIHGGIATYRDRGFMAPGEFIEVLDVSIVGPMEGRINIQMGSLIGSGDLDTRLFLSTAGD